VRQASGCPSALQACNTTEDYLTYIRHCDLDV